MWPELSRLEMPGLQVGSKWAGISGRSLFLATESTGRYEEI